MWFVIQLGEYQERGGDSELIQALKPRVIALLQFLSRFKNSDGLLEKLPSWVFVEWSKANEFVQDVNYPSNMLYAGVLETVSTLYNLPQYKEEAEKIRQVIRQQSFNEKFFVDNAVRKDGRLEVTPHCSEVCQYFAFFFKVATAEAYPELWRVLKTEFGPERQEKNKYPEVHYANAFVGNALRAELLTLDRAGQQVLDEAIGYLGYQAEKTMTLWENMEATASLNHGFASHIVSILDRVALGIRKIDPIKKKVWVEFLPLKLAYCRGSIPVEGAGGKGLIEMSWRQDDKRIYYHLEVPPGYRVEMENFSGQELIKR